MMARLDYGKGFGTHDIVVKLNGATIKTVTVTQDTITLPPPTPDGSGW